MFSNEFPYFVIGGKYEKIVSNESEKEGRKYGEVQRKIEEEVQGKVHQKY